MIQQLKLNHFTCFEDTTFDFSEGINVFIGENGTGKTHILKLLFAILKSKDSKTKEDLASLLKQNLLSFFKADDLDSLWHKKSYPFAINCTINQETWDFQSNDTTLYTTGKTAPIPADISSVYLPTKEILSFFKGFLSLYEKRELEFDETYKHLALALDTALLKERPAKEQGLFEFIQELKEILQGADVVQESGRFYLKKENTKTEIALVAEGWRKIATLIYLILNGEIALNKNMVLFIDEPESNLNPKLIESMARFLIRLAKRGVQIFVATHDYLLSNYLSLHSQKENSSLRFFSITKTADVSSIETGDSFTALDQNIILDEYSRYYDVKTDFLYSNK